MVVIVDTLKERLGSKMTPAAVAAWEKDLKAGGHRRRRRLQGRPQELDCSLPARMQRTRRERAGGGLSCTHTLLQAPARRRLLLGPLNDERCMSSPLAIARLYRLVQPSPWSFAGPICL
ncbi:hypothetical protein HPB50_025609 [Hyalomma asiaticum]|uniref:Uncharacterized protein n=1 Tax=Hyalomma asiaticum TaxID=266040 RepID=A0ACB7TE77_HYAAI|nr:hypothetical protein HPB50_025609 [Hyalomma asiaticum]